MLLPLLTLLSLAVAAKEAAPCGFDESTLLLEFFDVARKVVCLGWLVENAIELV
jgi:hypothetical protein